MIIVYRICRDGRGERRSTMKTNENGCSSSSGNLDPATAARNKRNLERLLAEQAQRRVQAFCRGSKRGTEDPVHPDDPRASDTDNPEISMVGAYGTKCGCCDEVCQLRNRLFQHLRSESPTVASDSESDAS